MNARGERILIFGDELSAHSSGSSTVWDVSVGSNRSSAAPGDLLASLLVEQGAAAARVNARAGRSATSFWQVEPAQQLIAADAQWRPTKVVIILGTHDVGLDPSTSLAAFKALRDAYKATGAEVWAIGPFASSKPPAGVEVVVRAMRDVFSGRFIDGRGISALAQHADDGVHYTSGGARTLALALADALLSKPSPASLWGGVVAGVLGTAALVGFGVWWTRRGSTTDLLADAGTDAYTAPEQPSELAGTVEIVEGKRYSGPINALIRQGFKQIPCKSGLDKNGLARCWTKNVIDVPLADADLGAPKKSSKKAAATVDDDDDFEMGVPGVKKSWLKMLKSKRETPRGLEKEVAELKQELARLTKKKVPAKNAPNYAYQSHCRMIEHTWEQLRGREEALAAFGKPPKTMTERPATCPPPMQFKYWGIDIPMDPRDREYLDSWGRLPKPEGYDERQAADAEHRRLSDEEYQQYKARGFWGPQLGEPKPDGYRVAYQVRAVRTLHEGEPMSQAAAIKLMRAYKRRGMTAWVEDAAGNFVPVPGAKRRPSSLGAPNDDEDSDDYFERIARAARERAATVERALTENDAVVITARGGRRILAIKTPEMSNRDEGSIRVTIFDEDGPLGHTTRDDLAKIAKELASDWAPDAIEPASEADVVAWTSTERFAAGAKRVAAVQRANAGLEGPLVPTSDAVRKAEAALARAGWELKNAEIDLVNNRARIEVSRGSRYVTLDVQNGKASVTREEIDRVQTPVGRRGDRAIVERLRPRLLGREKFPVDGVRSALRFFSNYIDDNGSGALVGREAFRALLTASSEPTNAGLKAPRRSKLDEEVERIVGDRDAWPNLDEIRRRKPRPLLKLYRNPTPEQEATWKAQMSRWNSEYRKAQKLYSALVKESNRRILASRSELGEVTPPQRKVARGFVSEAKKTLRVLEAKTEAAEEALDDLKTTADKAARALAAKQEKALYEADEWEGADDDEDVQDLRARIEEVSAPDGEGVAATVDVLNDDWKSGIARLRDAIEDAETE